MSDQPPTPSVAPPTAVEAAQTRDQIEEQVLAVYAAAAAFVAANPDSEQEPEEGHPVRTAALIAALLLIRAQAAYTAAKLAVPSRDSQEPRTDQVATAVARRAVEDARAHYSTVSKRVQKEDPEATDRMIASTMRADKAWTEAAARTTATRLAAETAMSMQPDVEEVTGEPHSLLWVSRGDPKVRKLHRTLHGRVRPPGTPFHTWPTGQELKYPGDPKAPLDATINCRCGLILVPSADAAKAETVFEVPDADFDVPLAASGSLERDRAERELRSELSRRYL